MTDSVATIASRLTGLRSDFPGCRLAVFIDLSTEMVLSASAFDTTPQEDLDGLCHAGVVALSGVETNLVWRHLFEGDTGQGRSVILLEGAYLRCFIRSAVIAEDALCLICDPDVDCDTLIDGATTVLHAIGREG